MEIHYLYYNKLGSITIFSHTIVFKEIAKFLNIDNLLSTNTLYNNDILLVHIGMEIVDNIIEKSIISFSFVTHFEMRYMIHFCVIVVQCEKHI